MSTSILANLPENFGKLHHSREKSPLRNTKKYTVHRITTKYIRPIARRRRVQRRRDRACTVNCISQFAQITKKDTMNIINSLNMQQRL